MKLTPSLVATVGLFCLILPACHQTHAEEQAHHEHHKIVVTSPQIKDVVTTQQYVCQIRSQRHIDVCALANGFLMTVPIKEGQAVKKGDIMFQILPTLYKSKLDAEVAEVRVAQIEFDSTNKLFNEKTSVVSQTEVALYQAKLLKAQANANKAEAELNFATVRAPFDGIVDRLLKQQGSKI